MGEILSGPEIKAPKQKKAVRPANKKINQATNAAKNLKPAGFSGGGLTAKFNNGNVNVTSSGARKGLVGSLADRFLEQAGLTSDLRARVAPGVSDLRKVRLQEIENARSASISNLRDNLARRRVLGSSFGEDAITRTEREFAQESERVAAESFLQEIDLMNQLVQQEFDLRRQAVATQLNELNLQADLAAGLTSEANNIMAQSAQLQGQLALGNASFRASLFNTQSGTAQQQALLDAEAQKGAGELIGKVAGVALAPATGGASLALTGAPVSITNNNLGLG